jgi:isopenicillin N synthase-like dioxygenase
MKLLNVPVIDLKPFRRGSEADKKQVAEAVDRACCDIGFLIIKGHGISPELIARTREVSRDFFDLPLADKKKLQGHR